ncbi:MAG: hypothetical protein EP330_08980 [Deltaproteobacteria bacterium]|nr:MAG: hypothetical protein EP330_08980 [Deltaproteobacteria bacterium]
MSDVDELFGADDGAKPNTALVTALLASGVTLSVLGLACSVLPGGALILFGFHYADRELDRVDSGYLAEADRPKVQQLRMLAQVAVVWLLIAIVAQLVLLSIGVYDGLWGAAILAARTLLGSL